MTLSTNIQIIWLFVTCMTLVNGMSVSNYEHKQDIDVTDNRYSSGVTCSEDDDCEDTQKCRENEQGWNICQCADGLSGSKCDVLEWCTKTGKFQGCKDDHGTCVYVKEKRSVDCICAPGKELHPIENKCTSTLCKPNPCQNSGYCKVDTKGEKFFCDCPGKWKGKTCNFFCDCGKNGRCSLDDNGKKVCNCDSGYEVRTKYDEDKCAACDCGINGKCEFDEDGFKDCKCDSGFAIKTVEGLNKCVECDCGSNATCSIENDQNICYCKEGFSYREGKCIATCFKDDDCKSTQKCLADEQGWNTCQCADGLSGPNCDELEWCTKTGKFQNCSGDHGTCVYVKEKRSVDCICGPGKELHPVENKCTRPCLKDDDCKDPQKCRKNEQGWNICQCADGLSGPFCDVLEWCIKPGKFQDCKGDNGTCVYVKEKRSVDCICAPGKELHPVENKCADCDCGPNGTCSIENGQKICHCEDGFSYGDGKCTECDCGPNGTCSIENSQKICDCKDGFSYKDGKCTATCFKDDDCKTTQKCLADEQGWNTCECADGLSGPNCDELEWCTKTGKYENCSGDHGTCVYVQEKRSVDCICGNGTELHPTENKCRVCDCGEKSNKCYFDEYDNKVCVCLPGYMAKNGLCSGFCDSNLCGNGTCHIAEENVIYCRCYEGFSGPLCEERITVPTNMIPLFIGIFSFLCILILMLSGTLCYICLKKNKF